MILYGMSLLSMRLLMAAEAKNYEILLRVIPQLAPPLNVMDLKIFRSSTALATPTVPFQDFTAEPAISFGFKP
jgi:hypothetical protein